MKGYRALRKAIQWAYFCIAMMLFTFVLMIIFLLGQFSLGHQMAILQGLLYILIFWTVVGGLLGIRVAYLKKQYYD